MCGCVEFEDLRLCHCFMELKEDFWEYWFRDLGLISPVDKPVVRLWTWGYVGTYGFRLDAI